MASYTPNLNLYKPDDSDDYEDFREGFNDNMDILDQGGGGSGDVMDVEVNGISVVDAGTKIAEITSYEEVTIAEYESIPVAERESNGIAYFIKDLNNESVQGYPPLIYSTDEREVGVWVDGKPLYQKTIEFGTLPNNATKNVAHGISNLENIVDITCTARNTTSNNIIHIPHVHRTTISNQIQVSCDTTNVTVITASNSTQFNWCYFTLRYTKTTDVAGSGIWNGQGGIAHHYSTNETVIGTWVDGKPLYEKAYVNNGSDIVANSGNWTTLCSETWVQNVKQIVNSLFSRQAYSASSTGIFTPCEFMAENGAIKINPFRNLTFKSGAYFVIQYTKTSD